MSRVLAGFRLLSILLAANASIAQPQDGRLFPGHVYPVPDRPVAIASGDLNRDGYLDLVTANMLADSVSVLLGESHARFQPPATYPVGIRPVDLALGDLNADGNLDVVVVNSWGTAASAGQTVSVLLGDGLGGLGSVTHFSASTGPTSVSVADFDADGKLDVVLSKWNGTGGVDVLLGDGAGSLILWHSITVSKQTDQVRVADLDEDSLPDLVIVTRGGKPQVVMNQGQGFASPVKVGVSGVTLVVGDVDQDGNLDLLSGGGGKFTLLPGDGSGGFGPPVSVTEPYGTFLEFADLTGDGLDDLILLEETHFVTVATGTGVGPAFPQRKRYAAHYAGDAVVGDFDRDGRVDLAVATGASVTVLLGEGTCLDGSQHFPVGWQPEAPAVGDFNRDGAPDLVVIDTTYQPLQTPGMLVLLGDGQGDFGPAVHVYQGYPTMREVAVGDFDGDALVDLVSTGNDSVWLFPGLGDGQFLAPSTFPAGFGARALAVVDVNHDQLLDVLTANALGDSISVLLGTGDGSFTLPALEFPASDFPTQLAVGDLNGDGDLDLVTNSAQNATITLLFGEGSGVFGPANPMVVPPLPRAVALGDTNGDGALDLLVGSPFAGKLAIFEGNGLGEFSAPSILEPQFGYFDRIVPSDFDADGILDLAVVGCGLTVLRGTGDGGFLDAELYPGGCGSTLAVADLDADGRNDVVADYALGRTVAVLLNQTAPVQGVMRFGAATPGLFGRVGISASRTPHAGDTEFAVTCTNVAPMSDGVLLVSGQPNLADHHPFQRAPLFHVDPDSAGARVLSIHSDAGGFSRLPIPIPDDPALVGSVLYAQAFWPCFEDIGASPPRCSSVGLQLIIGP